MHQTVSQIYENLLPRNFKAHTFSNDDGDGEERAGAKAVVKRGAPANVRRQSKQDLSVEIIFELKRII